MEVPAVLAEAFGHRAGAGIGSLGPPADTGPVAAESENRLAGGSHVEDTVPDRAAVLVLGVLRERPGDNCRVAADAELMVV